MKTALIGAAAEGLPALTRRSFLGKTAIAVPAMGMAAIDPALAMPVEVSPRLADLIAEFHSAEDHYRRCLATENAIIAALGDNLNAPWRLPREYHWDFGPGRQFASIEHMTLEMDRAEEATKRSMGESMMMEKAFHRRMDQIARIRQEGKFFFEGQDTVVRAAGYYQAEQQTDDAQECGSAAFAALMEYPCETLVDVRAKAALFVETNPVLDRELDLEEAIGLLQSFLGRVS